MISYYEAIDRIKEHMRLHPGLHSYYTDAFHTAISVLQMKSDLEEKYNGLKPDTTLYFVNEVKRTVETCRVIKIEYGLKGLRSFTVKFDHREIGEYMASFLGYLFFLDEDTALEELDRHLGTCPGGPNDGSEDNPKDDPEEDDSTAAVVNGTKYESLVQCISEVEAGSKIIVMQDVELSTKLTINKSLTLDLNGHSIENDEGAFLALNNAAEVVLTNDGEAVEIKQPGDKWAIQVSGNAKLTLGRGITVKSPNTTTAILLSSGSFILDGGSVENNVGQAIHGQSNSNILVKDGIVNSKGYAIRCQSGTSAILEAGSLVGTLGGIDAYSTGTVAIKGGTICTDGYAIAVWDTVTLNIEGEPHIQGGCGIITNGSATPSNQGVVINASGGVFEGTYVGAYLPAGTLNVKGSAQIRGKSGILVRGGTLNIEAGTIEATGEGVVNVGDAGYAVPVAGIAVDRNEKYNNGNVAVVISGGTISAKSGVPALNFTLEGNSEKAETGISVLGGTFSDTSADEYKSC